MAPGEKIKGKSQQRLRQHAGGDVFDCPVIKRPPGSFNTYGKKHRPEMSALVLQMGCGFTTPLTWVVFK